MSKNSIAKKIIIGLIIVLLALGVLGLALNQRVIDSGSENLLLSLDENMKVPEGALKELKDFRGDCIIVLGCGIIDYDTPTDLLADRLDAGIALYNMGVAPKLLLTGDNGTQHHNEIHVMLNYCLDRGVPAEDIFCDHAGFSTSESMIRARNIFGVKRAIVVTQKYHEYRALYLGEALGMDVKGVAAEQRNYKTQFLWEAREILARDKDLLKMAIGNEEAVGGDPIPITGDGTVSHGE